jgi:hypothetical protein
MNTIYDYIRTFSKDLEQRVLQQFPPLQSFEDPLPPQLSELRRAPLPAQAVTIAGIAKGWKLMRSIKLVGEMGTGKSLCGVAASYVHAAGKPYTAVTMCPPHIVEKWAREVLLTIPNARSFVIYDCRNGGDPRKPHGIVEVKLIKGKITRTGWRGSLADLRALGRKGWSKFCSTPAFFIVSRETGKLSYFWRHAFHYPPNGKNKFIPVNPETGEVILSEDGTRLMSFDFDQKKISEVVNRPAAGTKLYSPLWSADRNRIVRMAPLEYMGRYMKRWFDYAIADEMHELAGDTAQGQGLAVLERVSRRILGQTGTLTGGFADDCFNLLVRLSAPELIADGFAYGSEGRKAFQAAFGTIEEIKSVRESDNKCSNGTKSSIRIKRKPGISPVLFAKYLLNNTAFLYLEDVSDALPPYDEFIVPVEMSKTLQEEYERLQDEFIVALGEHPKAGGSIRSLMLNTLMLYPDHPFEMRAIDARVWCNDHFERVTVAQPRSLPRDHVYPKERALIDDIRKELNEGRRCQVFVTYTGKYDMTQRLASVLQKEGIRVAVLKSTVATDKREAWYAARVAEGVQVVICHPRLVCTGLDLLSFPTIVFYQTGYSLHTLRQASRRSWRIGQNLPVRVKYLTYSDTTSETAQEKCLRHMGRKALVALATEGRFSSEGLADYGDDDTDLLTALGKELVEDAGVGQSASEVWKSLKHERERLFGTSHAPVLPVPVEAVYDPTLPQDLFTVFSDGDKTNEPYAEMPATTGVARVLQFPSKGRSKRGIVHAEEVGQLQLFA